MLQSALHIINFKHMKSYINLLKSTDMKSANDMLHSGILPRT